MYSPDEIEEQLIILRNKTEINVDDLMRLSALQERIRLFEKLRWLIQQKDSTNDIVAAEVLSWAWQQLADQ
jgi:hypothetical protein